MIGIEFSIYSEAYASEYLFLEKSIPIIKMYENLGEMLCRYYMLSDVLRIFKSSITQ